MNRIIKFRCWDKVNHLWLDYIKISTNGILMTAGDYQMIPIQRPEEVEIMQFTGLKDKNEKEIYEGDILKMWRNVYSRIQNQAIDDPNDDEGIITKVGSVVYRNSGGFMLAKVLVECGWQGTTRTDYTSKQRYAQINRSYNIQVIGNIYEDPELLK